MLPGESITLCRVCLCNGAKISIFNNEENGIYEKLSACLQEKVEDVEGFPKYICKKCLDMLNMACDFIARYKESYNILLHGIHFVKEEKLSDNDYREECSGVEDDMFDHNIFNGPANEDVKTKLEPAGSCDEDQTFLIDLIKPIKVKNNTKQFKSKKLGKPVNKPCRPCNIKSKAVATSILEGSFTWDGEKWCSSKQPSNIQFTDPEMLQRRKWKRQKDLEKLIKKKNKKPNKKGSTQKLCDLCGEIFGNKDRLLHHRQMVHFPKKLKCPECPRISKTLYYLNRHIRRQHQKKDFICSECGKEFAFLNELNSHIKKTHKKEEFPKKVFACSFCGKTYACQKSVTIHERSVHTGERPAVCSVCNSTFFHEEYLREHMRLHTGETPFKCPVCKRGYAQLGNMKSHIKQHRVSDLDHDLLTKIKPSYLRLMKP